MANAGYGLMAVSFLSVRLNASYLTSWYGRVTRLHKSHVSDVVSSREAPSSAAGVRVSCYVLSSVSPYVAVGSTEIATSFLPYPMVAHLMAKAETKRTKVAVVPTILGEVRPATTLGVGSARYGFHVAIARPASSPSLIAAFATSVALRFTCLVLAIVPTASCPIINGRVGSSCKLGFRCPLGISEDGSYGSFSPWAFRCG